MHSACVLGTHTCIHFYVRRCSRKPMLQTSVNKQMAPQHCNFTTLQLLLCSCGKHFLAYYMKKGGYRGFAKLYISYLICLLNTFGVEGGKSISIFDLHPAGHRSFPGSQWVFASCLPLSRLLELCHSLQGTRRWKAVMQTSRGCNCTLVNMRERGISDGIRNHKISADVSVSGGSRSGR